ncbi:hypothetical protein B566_EDAN015324 [Ephemera danica]|nr:hypothetical protein B566_EDAN015324 [Ephemera danica]
MIVPNLQLTDDSSDLVMNGASFSYKNKYFMLLQRCEQIQKDNERIVNRIHEVRKLLRRSRKDRKLLTTRLDQYGDSWRTAPQPVLKIEADQSEAGDNKPDIKPPPATTAKVSTSPVEKGTAKKASNSQPSKRKSKSDKEKDPNAPKRPANPFFQFCQEQRPIVTEQVVGEGHEEVSKQELTRLLANRWKTLSTENKKVYYDKYEKQKEKYAVDMQLYAAGTSSKDGAHQ